VKGRPLSFVALTTATLLTFPALAQAPRPTSSPLSQSLSGAAKTDYDAARLLFVDHDFAGALVKFTSAYDRSKDPRLIFNMAACEKNLRHYARAMGLLHRYVDEGKRILTPGDVHEADQLIEAFRPFVGGVRLQVNEGDAAITLDDAPAGASPLPTDLVIDIGVHHLRITKAGFVPFETTLKITGPATTPLDVTLTREVHEGVVAIHAGAGDSIALDGKIVATGEWTAHVPAGAHTLTVTADGMRTYQSDLFVEDDKSRTLTVTLEPLPKHGIPVWIVVTGGVILTTGAAVAAAAVYRSYNTLQTQPTPGSVSPGLTQTAWRFR
jgi:hypothetical protein